MMRPHKGLVDQNLSASGVICRVPATVSCSHGTALQLTQKILSGGYFLMDKDVCQLGLLPSSQSVPRVQMFKKHRLVLCRPT